VDDRGELGAGTSGESVSKMYASDLAGEAEAQSSWCEDGSCLSPRRGDYVSV